MSGERRSRAGLAALGVAWLLAGICPRDAAAEKPAAGMFLIAGPGGMDPAARDAIAAAVAEVLNADGSEAAGFITKGFGGVDLRAGDDLTAMIENAYEQAGGLLEASAE